ncbi:MAG: MGMT family protein [Elusimicrobiota bacterium]|nr:MGMT family protein [Elusimicrobiota bacterium]
MKKSFSDRCLNLIKEIPEGKVTTYKLIARALGTKAYRAVGRAVASNRNYPLTPCHRVVRSDGQLGGYSPSGGIKKKAELLRQEGVSISGGYVNNMEKVIYSYD